MDTYSFLRELADSWVLLAMFVFFISAVLFAFRPGSTKTYDDVSQIPLRGDAPVIETGCTSCKNGGTCQKLKGMGNV